MTHGPDDSPATPAAPAEPSGGERARQWAVERLRGGGGGRVPKPMPRPFEDNGHFLDGRSPELIERQRTRQEWLDQQEAEQPRPRPAMRRIRGHAIPRAGRADLY